MLCHLHFAWVGAAVLRLKGSAAVVCDALSGVFPGAHQCFGCGFLVPRLSAKSGCFGEYLNVFAGFCVVLFGFMRVFGIYRGLNFRKVYGG